MKLYNLLFSSREKRYDTIINARGDNIKELKKKILVLEKEQLSQHNQIERIKYLINDRTTLSNNISIQETSKGLPILVAVNLINFEIEIFDLITENSRQNRTIVLWAQKNQNRLHIQDIQGGRNLGHGSVAMKVLIEYAEDNGIEKITGNLSQVDYDHKDRLIAFYEKFGFVVEYQDDKKGKIIKLIN